jgi:hypothetical protein
LRRHIKCPPKTCIAPSISIEQHSDDEIGIIIDPVINYKHTIAEKFEEIKRTSSNEEKLACFEGLTLKEFQSLLKHSEKVHRKSFKRKRELLKIVEELKSVDADIQFCSQMIEHCTNLRDIEVKRKRLLVQAQLKSLL